MEVICNNYMPGDSRLVEKLVSELKSQGIFDQFRKECISDVDTKPAYQNLRQRVEGTVTTFLNQQAWSIDLNKNQLREQLRKNLHESGFLETGVERIVDQVVNPKISTVFLPKVEDVVYRFLGIERPAGRIVIKKEEKKVSITDLLPTDLEAVSPESVDSFKTEKKNDSLQDSLPSSGKMEEDESPPFEPLGIQNSHENSMSQDDTKMQIDEHSRDSHLSGFSGLESHESNQGSDTKTYQMDLSNHDSLNSIETRLSIITSEDTIKMEIFDDFTAQIKNNKFEITSEEVNTANDAENTISVVPDVKKEEPINDIISEKIEEPEKKDRKHDNKQDDKKSRSSDKSKDRKEDKHKKSSSSSKDKEKSSSKHKDSKDKDSNKKDSKSSSSSHRDKDKSKERSSDSKDKDKSSKYKDKNEKSKHEKDKTAEKSKSDKDAANKDEKNRDKYKSDKNKYEKDKSSSKEKDRYKSDKDRHLKDKEKSKHKDRNDKDRNDKDRNDKDRNDKDRNDKDRNDKDRNDKDRNDKDRNDKDRNDKDRNDKDRNDKDRNDKERSSKSKEKSDRDKDKNSKEKSSRDKDNSVKERVKDNNKDYSKDKIKTSSSNSSSSGSKHSSSKESSSKDKKDKYKDSTTKTPVDDSKSKSSSSDKSRKEDTRHSSSKKDHKDSKKKSKDDHYSSKIKKTDRRSTDRDSNDGTSSKNNNCLNNYSESMSSKSENNSQDQSNSSFSGGSGDSGNSDQVESATHNAVEITVGNGCVQVEQSFVPMQIQPMKYMKPKFALNFEEARKIMKIRKQLARMERQNQLSLTRIDVPPIENGIAVKEVENVIVKDSLPNNIEVDNEQSIDLLSDETVKEKVNNITDNLVCISEDSIISSNEDKKNLERDEHKEMTIESTNLSMENFEALEAKLAQVMSKINYNSYESDEDYEFHGYSSTDLLDSIPKQAIDFHFTNTEMQSTNYRLDKEVDSVYILLDDRLSLESENHRLNNVPELSVVLNKCNSNDDCLYLEKPTLCEENNLKFLRQIVSKLQTEINDAVETTRNNFWPLNRGKKRKLEECVDFRNNNDIGYTTTDIPDEHFSLPLSPAESDKSNDRKEEDLLIPMKQKRIIRGYSQRYSSEDLYKPRPIISRRNRFSKNTN
ncbi:unnamed protein product [Psylliodes chrysocephalus]|uniref:BOD1/SHG1 domain-containing protein n=1 Tax=Psylliodes chrysocephalus TaxID=3402493 RepID=A0A9P0CFT8_9CUCU|nr:unnamed protein product [Psylliodes chrysocephala]